MRKILILLFFIVGNLQAQKVYLQNECVVIEGVGIYPSGKLYISENGDLLSFSATTRHDPKYIEYTASYTRLKDSTNSPFASLAAAREYLTSIISSQVKLTSSSTTINTRGVLYGTTDGGAEITVPVTQEGHLEVALHEPLGVFGDISVEQTVPVYQTDFSYGVNNQQVYTTSTGSGTITSTNQLMQVSTGTVQYSYGVAESRKRMKYRAGQGVRVSFTAMYTNPVANSYQGVGCGTAENGCYFGYGNTSNLADTSFGILYVYNGKREIKTLTVTVGATTASTVTVTLNATNYTVSLTDASNVQRTVYELSQATYAGWAAYPSGSTVVFIRQSAGVTAGTQSFNAGTTGASATIAQTRAGLASTDTFIPQSSWNGDKLDGTGASGYTINPQKINLFRIKIGYLGAHDLIFQVKVTPPNANNSTWVTVHTIKFANLNDRTSFTNASFPFNSFAYSAGSATNLTVSVGSYAGHIEGKKMLSGDRASVYNSSTAVTNSAFTPLFTILNSRVYNGVANQTVVNVINLSGALKHNNPCGYYIVKNATLTGNPNFQAYSTSSCLLYDVAATGGSWADNNQLYFVDYLGDTGDIDKHFGNGEYNGEEFTLQPGESITVFARSLGSGSPTFVTSSLNLREDK